ncbi:MAG: CHAT domain-containing protein, partial [Nitrospinales bacterium]|nr:CHAT domain-containing protein [Nitrospinales bacterium]
MGKLIVESRRVRKETFSFFFSFSILLLSFFILIGCSSDSGGGSSSTTPDTETSDGGTGDGKPGAEGLSGLARSFFYAGARSLLVSHWPVETNSAMELTTGIFDEMKTNPEIGRAEALR